MKQSQKLQEPLGRMSNGRNGNSIFDIRNICRTCRLQYPKSCTHCEECKKPLAYKPRTRRK
ncbi:MAG: hypothetical protein K5790_10255 [Nitrosopumilus sp.]|uniref:hypothetical protein n=1 Tax=Nitrosopumilus sp. TaxID=2024843 RepID=UPI00247C16CF|nr:hypothetical protein [Nitrosopumilus sp.]MCV0393651.1 hypothetical protein [Nitrosopumilus sp.]